MRDNERATPPSLVIQFAARIAIVAGLMMLTATGCVRDADCGICDADKLLLESISGVNYASTKVNILNPACEGPDCPAPIDTGLYFIEEIGPCEETEEAQASPDPVEFCKLSPLVTAFGVEFVFNNLLEPTSLELVRKRPDNPQLFEVYDWRSDVLRLEGPTTRFNGDYVAGRNQDPDLVTRIVNLACIENLREDGIDFSHTDYQDPATNPCNQVDPDTGLPRKLRENGTIETYRGSWTPFGGNCASPEEGPDTCCTRCDWLLSTQIARYGVDDAGTVRSPNAGTAITCDATTDDGNPVDDVFDACRNFVISANREEEEQTWTYHWSCAPGTPGCETEQFKLARADNLRETHPDDRPAWLLNNTAKCAATSECGSIHALTGTQCIGQQPGGQACLIDTGDAACTQGTCQPQWFVTCRQNADTTGTATGYCVDRRFADTGTAGCFSADANGQFQALCEVAEGGGRQCAGTAGPGSNFALCDGNENSRLTSLECCAQGLGGPAWNAEPDPPVACDPFYQSQLAKAPIYDRSNELPEQARDCICKLPADEGCESVVETGCLDDDGNLRSERTGQYAVKFVRGRGGVVYDPAIKGFDFRPADVGGILRADIESCAEANVGRLIGSRNRHDGWRANDAFLPETRDDFDRAMCSGQTYTAIFSEPGGDASYIEDKIGNTLEGKARYTFQTSLFHVVPRSGFPSDNLRIGACNDFALRFSNKFDLSPENLSKLRIFRLDDDGSITTPNQGCDDPNAPVAGGPDCSATDVQLQAARADASNTCPPPCLTVDVQGNGIGEVGVEIDPTQFGAVLQTGETYRLLAPTAATLAEGLSPDQYRDVFWDACGMPLVAENAEPYLYDFTIDTPKCKEDADNDLVQLSCDNAPGFFNPDQGDIDNDGIGDVIDLCPLIPGPTSNSADSDKDGVGNECDNCRQETRRYNEDASALGIPDYMRVRNIPFQQDTDRDGIGDACDNCVRVANCQDYDADNPYRVGDPIAFNDNVVCQQDDDSNMIGNACAGQMDDAAAGPVGLTPDDDFDQDGLANVADFCPRQPLSEIILCTSDADCPGNTGLETSISRCTDGVCNHRDTDNDAVGDICDTCAFNANQMQITEGEMQEDDPDGDFVGDVCETDNECGRRRDPRPFAFHEVASNGNCCIRQLMPFGEIVALGLLDPQQIDDLETELGRPVVEADLFKTLSLSPLIDPDGLSVRVQCSNDEVLNGVCRRLEPDVVSRPGVLALAPGCQEALDTAGISVVDNTRRTGPAQIDVAAIALDDLWQKTCFLPQFDQDFDGLGEVCDLCPFDFDPANTRYTDDNGRLWPTAGAFCNGAYNIENRCVDTTDVDTGTETGDDGGGLGTGG